MLEAPRRPLVMVGDTRAISSTERSQTDQANKKGNPEITSPTRTKE
jgi:hypothetical protein